jgi:sulfide dehydrogenase cytochrome subunit
VRLEQIPAIGQLVLEGYTDQNAAAGRRFARMPTVGQPGGARNQMLNRVTALAAAAAALVAGAPAQAQNANPQLLTISCAGCHGTGGHSTGAIPSIFGRSAASIAETLRAFRDGRQPSTVMVRIAKGYTDAEIDAVAREISTHWKD